MKKVLRMMKKVKRWRTELTISRNNLKNLMAERNKFHMKVKNSVEDNSKRNFQKKNNKKIEKKNNK